MIHPIKPERNNSINIDGIEIDNILLNYYKNFVKVND